MKKPYIKKYGKVSGFNIWMVDGGYIRKNLNEEFNNFGQHYRFKFIPKNEFWIDQEHGLGREEKYYIDHMLVENRLMALGKSYDKAFDRAERIERCERRKSRSIKLKKKNSKDILFKRIHKRLLKKYSKKIEVWIVNGKLVRDNLFIEFTEGGHDRVYHFIPKNEIWIDDDLNKRELKFILLHELHERNLILKGWPYDSKKRSAHRISSNLEYHYRHHPKGIDKRIKQELNKIK